MKVIIFMTLVLIMLFVLKRLRKLWFVFVFVIVAFQAKSIIISGSEPSYAGRTLQFMTLTDPVSKNEKPVFQLVIDEKGNFSTEVKISEALYCFYDIGIYRGEIILDPDENLKLKLPAIKEKSFEESKNPYFEPVEIWLLVNDGSDKSLTNLVSRFDARFYKLSDQYFNQLYYRNLKNYLDTIRIKLEPEFAKYSHPYFLIHRQIRFKSIEAEMARAGREKIIGALPSIQSGGWDQPAFNSLLNSLFVNTLSNESKTMAGSGIKQWIRERNLAEFKKWASAFTATTSPLTELVMLKMLHDAFYSGVFSKPAILQLLRSDFFGQHNNPEIVRISNEVISKITYLERGSRAPEICLPLLAQSTWCSTGNTNPYLYILFADLEIPVCQEQVKYMKTLAEKCGTGLQIVLVVSPSIKVNIPEFISKYQVPGLVVTDSKDQKTARNYRVRSYPSAFLLDKNHKVMLAPAKTPLDGFEFQFEGYKK
jgi:hypothetical protein